MNKVINSLSIFSLFIICFSFILPNIMLSNDESAFEMIVYREAQENKLNVDVKDIYLVKAIHNIAKYNSQISIVSKDKKISEYEIYSNNKDLMDELNKLAEYNIIKNRLKNTDKLSIGIIDKYIKTADFQYTIRNETIEEENIKLDLGIEVKSGKILNMSFYEEDLIEDFSKEEVLTNFVKYLGLDVIDDWKMEDEMLKTEKAGLIVILAKDDNKYLLTINSNEILYVKN